MRKIILGLAALLMGLSSSPALAMDAFEEARQSIVAGDLESALLGITMGAFSVNMQDEDGLTLLHYAAQKGSLGAVQALLDRGADPAIRAKSGSTPADMTTVPEVRAVLSAAIAAQ
ncbi:ankyrin repeat domain-containing protein [Sphingobium boeckii]|uniref:Ankyrin repeat protein n=1 Tax=Sphingobium boeckii TaxID=1082345 RepID=A0A7W9EEE5_9SPHN|nr:ankyrin repeat domain-containing protein [Sphingobium boeckii]MBB5685939.1 ankyrin repeat protein [Sphingobium boeckii]